MHVMRPVVTTQGFAGSLHNNDTEFAHRPHTGSGMTGFTCQCLPLGPGGRILTGPRARLWFQRLKPPVNQIWLHTTQHQTHTRTHTGQLSTSQTVFGGVGKTACKTYIHFPVHAIQIPVTPSSPL